MRKHPAGLVQGIGGPPAPMVKFLPNAPTTLIQGVAGEVYDVEGIHDCGCVWEFFSGGALKPGESIHRYDLDVAAPRVGAGGQPGFEDLLGATRDHVQEPRGAATVADGRQVQDNSDAPVPIRGVTINVFINTDDTHAIEPSQVVDEYALAFGQDSGVGGSSRTRLGPGRCEPLSDGGPPGPPVPNAPLRVRAWRVDRPLGSCFDATREHTSGSGSGARSRARSWSSIRRVRELSA